MEFLRGKYDLEEIMANLNIRRKALFHTPAPGAVERLLNDSAALVTSKIHFEQEIVSGQASVHKGLHEQRLKKLRKKLDALAQDDWKYPTIESLIGLK